MQRYVVLFDSIHDVLCAERTLLASQLWHDLVPIPKELSSSCGMAVELRSERLEEALAKLRARCRPWADVFICGAQGTHQRLAPTQAAETR
jgi:hypothetical protein